jgi:hypothetical protein
LPRGFLFGNPHFTTPCSFEAESLSTPDQADDLGSPQSGGRNTGLFSVVF